MSITLASRPAFAKLHGVSKAAVQKWEARGAVVVVDGKISVEASDRLLMHSGLGRFSGRPRKPDLNPSPVSGAPASAAVGTDGAQIEHDVLMPVAVNLLVSYFNRICAFAALAAWENGASIETAKQTDQMFRALAMEAATEVLTEIDASRPDGFAWEDQPIWDLDRMAQIDWSSVEAPQ
ncbi:hypothetical protein [Brevundimonas sp. SGAir0440]|uniref:hypothetical protein n=1 Tax=Brevundimonas sp. SGAir0440 TaxID=2579977 RepID=UPI0010CD6BEB|nr:hypothetical protein [Brevundimonas sp. SGAir0440]QCQ97739.1 hypothetical protein E7T10_03175 [Brevundimonas sp. SGAir0440]